MAKSMKSVLNVASEGVALEGGLLFDRCRLVDCCDVMEDALYKRMLTWSKAALKAAKADL